MTTQFKQLVRHICIVDNFVHSSADNFEKWCVFKVVEYMLGRLLQQVKSSQEMSIFYWRKHLICPLPYNKKKHGIQTFKNVSLYTVIYIDCNSKKG